jgi:hypothetical protein
MTMLRQPPFGGITVFSEIKQFGVVGVLLKDTHGTDGRSFDDLKMKIADDGMRTQDFHQHDVTNGEIALVEGDAGGRRVGLPLSLRFLLDQARDAVAILPRGELLVEARGRLRRTIGVSDE